MEGSRCARSFDFRLLLFFVVLSERVGGFRDTRIIRQGMLTKQSLSYSNIRQLEDMMASKSFCKGSKFSYIGLNEVELPVSERSEYPRFFVLQEGKIVYKLFTDRYFESIYIPSKSGEMIEISRGLRLPQTREGVIRFLRKRATTELESQSKKEHP